MFKRLPAQARTAAGLSKLLEIDRGTSTRLVQSLSAETVDVGVLKLMPGVMGLRLVASALSKFGIGKTALANLQSGIDQFEEFLQTSAGSQRKLNDRIEATVATKVTDEQEQAKLQIERRRRAFEAMSQALGQRCDVMATCMVMRPTPGKENLTDHATMRYVGGYRARPDAPVLAFRSIITAGTEEDTKRLDRAGSKPFHGLERDEYEVAGATVLSEFTTDPVPLVAVKHVVGPGQHSLIVVDSKRTDEERGLDFATVQFVEANRPLPWSEPPPDFNATAYIPMPCARLIFDMYMERSMVARCVPSVAAYRTSPYIGRSPHEKWTDRLPHALSLQLINGDRQSLQSPFMPRMNEFVNASFDRMGWNINDFVCHRLEVEYPYWCGYYNMYFDFSDSVEGAGKNA